MSPGPKLPALAAGPDAVRAYLAQALVSHNATSYDLANGVAGLWGIGRGSELREAPVKFFTEIFGDFNGWLLYRIVHEDELEEWKHSIVGIISFCKYSVKTW